MAKSLAAAAEIAGIHSPRFLCSDVALTWPVVSRKHIPIGPNETTIMIVETGTREYNVSSIDILAPLHKPCKVFAGLRYRANFGASIDQRYTRDQVRRHYYDTALDQPLQVLPNHLMLHMKQISNLTDTVGKDIVESGQASRDIPVPRNDKDFVLVFTQPDTSLLAFLRYLEGLQRDLKMFCDGNRILDLCVLTGELACLGSLQSLVQLVLAVSHCDFVPKKPEMRRYWPPESFWRWRYVALPCVNHAAAARGTSCRQ